MIKRSRFTWGKQKINQPSLALLSQQMWWTLVCLTTAWFLSFWRARLLYFWLLLHVKCWLLISYCSCLSFSIPPRFYLQQLDARLHQSNISVPLQPTGNSLIFSSLILSNTFTFPNSWCATPSISWCLLSLSGKH